MMNQHSTRHLVRVLASRSNIWNHHHRNRCCVLFSSNSTSTPNEEDDYFRLLQIPRAFSIDEAQLKQQYRTLMKELHPDVNNNNNNNGNNNTDDAASSVTHAYDTLRRPHQRASHLMELLGRPLHDDGQEGIRNESVSPEFLMSMMEKQEQVANVDLADDDDNETTDNGGNNAEEEGAGAVQLRELWRQAVLAMDETGRRLQQAVDDNDLDTAHRCTGELQYWNRLVETLHELVPRR
jgi:DnaJ-domain-containing protein 1